MITVVNDLGNEISYTEEEFIVEVNSMIDFALNEKEYELKDLSVKMIGEDVTGVFGEFKMTDNGLRIIYNCLKNYSK